VNNYFTIAIDPQAVLLMALLVVLAIAIIRLSPMGLRA
jgi:preprotein translocase subunit Sec61beta